MVDEIFIVSLLGDGQDRGQYKGHHVGINEFFGQTGNYPVHGHSMRQPGKNLRKSFIKLGFLQIIPLKLSVQICQSFNTNIFEIVNFTAFRGRGTETRCAVQKQF